MEDLKNLVWQEKYRPKKVEDVITNYKEQILNAMKNPKSIQNYIFYSRIGGTGKTSIAKAIVRNLDCDVLNMNASADRSIENVRTKVKDFMLTLSKNPNSKKCVLLDEGEKLTKDAADALKNMMEEYSNNVFILMTTNDINKIPAPLQTRFKVLEFVQPNKDEVFKYLKNICKNENLEYDVEGINKIIEINYPSIRLMVNHLQDLFNQNQKVTIENVKRDDEIYEEIWKLIQESNYTKVKTKILSEGIDVVGLNRYIFNSLDSLGLLKEIKIVPLLARNERDFGLGADKPLIFINTLIDMIKVLRGD